MSFAVQYKQEQYTRRKKYVASVKVASGCLDCGLWGPDNLLSFDHVRGQKEFSIGQKWDVSHARLEAEIAKCEVVCLNCHALRTARRVAETTGPVFIPYPKTPRLFRDVTLTEKIDGTNAVLWIDGDGDVWAGSKNRWLTLDEDNFGFARWAYNYASSLAETLGEGVHHGEWWGSGIQRGYGLEKGQKRFSLFNVTRWGQDAAADLAMVPGLGVVPVLYEGPFTEPAVRATLQQLSYGSLAAPGFLRPEGIVVYHSAANQTFKVLLEGDELPKGLVA